MTNDPKTLVSELHEVAERSTPTRRERYLRAAAVIQSLLARIETLEAALRENGRRFIQIENIIARNLGRQDEKIEDARSIATEGWCSIDAAINGSDGK